MENISNIIDKANSIPGMIEIIEQQNLYNLASNLLLEKDDCLIEFGTFFGRSTYCISEGLIANSSKINNKIYAYDSFSCEENVSFSRNVFECAKADNLKNLIKKENGKVNFYNIFHHYLKNHIQSGLVRPMQFQLNNSKPPLKNKIAFMHIDSPKFYDELKFIFNKFFPYLKINSMIVFQDYFYHWSATLVASVQYLIELKKISIINTAATSLNVVLKEIVLESEFDMLEHKMQDIEFILKMLDNAILSTNNYKVERANIFVPRLLLAKFQILWDNCLYEKATNFLFNFVKRNEVHPNLYGDFYDLMKEGNSIREKYKNSYLS